MIFFLAWFLLVYFDNTYPPTDYQPTQDMGAELGRDR